jgi:hypothetical protein
MSLAALAAAVLGGIALPHALRLRRADPATAVVLWGSALGLRALLVLGTVVGALFLLHPGHLLDALAEFPCEGHVAAGHAAAALGGLALIISLALAAVRIVQATLAVRRLVHASVGLGPDNSLIVGGDDVVLAAAGITRPRLVVSAGALAHLDDDELAAALAHEHAHIRRCHRYVLLYAEFCRVLGRPLPGTTHASRQLRFHIERDADRSAVRGRADRLALASAICKAATGTPAVPRMVPLGGEGTAARVRELLETGPAGASRTLRALAAGATTLVVGVALSMPATLSGLGDPITVCGGG